MKNILVVDGALNCAYDIFRATESEFARIFQGEEKDIQFIENIRGDPAIMSLLPNLWKRPVAKSKVAGIHGLLFFGLPEKKEFYPNRLDSDLDGTGRAFSTRETT